MKNFELMKASLENNIKDIPNINKDQENISSSINSIINEFNIFSGKYNSLISENYSDIKNILLYY